MDSWIWGACSLVHIAGTEVCWKFCVTHCSKRNSLGFRRDEGVCKGVMEKGNDGYVPRREGAARAEMKHCMSLLVSFLIPLCCWLTGRAIHKLHDTNAWKDHHNFVQLSPGELGFEWAVCIQQKKKFLHLCRGYSGKVSSGGGVWVDGCPLLCCLLAVLALGPLVLPGHSVSELGNFSQFCSSLMVLWGCRKNPLFAWNGD